MSYLRRKNLTMITDMQKLIALSLTAILGVAASHAAVTLPQIISDGMVIQRDRPLTLWGTADPGEQVEIKVVKGPKASVKADASGHWRAELQPLKTGRTYTIEVGDRTVSDVAVGDVLLCSGQSNMELPVRRVTDMFADEIAAYRNPAIRHFIVPKEVDFTTERTDVSPTKWKSVDNDAMNFSALAYFTAKALNEKTGLPVGIINASWGGTPVEAWISDEAIAPFPRAVNEKRIYNSESYRNNIKKLEGENYARWNATMWAGDPVSTEMSSGSTRLSTTHHGPKPTSSAENSLTAPAAGATTVSTRSTAHTGCAKTSTSRLRWPANPVSSASAASSTPILSMSTVLLSALPAISTLPASTISPQGCSVRAKTMLLSASSPRTATRIS